MENHPLDAAAGRPQMRWDGDTWPQDRIDRLKALHAKGLTYTEIAAEIGGTRSSIGGKIARLQLTPKTQLAFTRRPTRPRTPPKPVPKPVPIEAPPSLDLPLESLGSDMCRYTAGEDAPYAFCAQPTKRGVPFCAYHVTTCYQPSHPARKQETA